jgi:hypothetical protein
MTISFVPSSVRNEAVGVPISGVKESLRAPGNRSGWTEWSGSGEPDRHRNEMVQRFIDLAKNHPDEAMRAELRRALRETMAEG